jgi:hypothetical protein
MKEILMTTVLFFTLSPNMDALAAIAVDANASSNCEEGCSSLSYSLTVGSSGTNRLLLVGAVISGGSGGGAPTVSSVTYGGQNLTQIATYLNQDPQEPGDANQARVDQWYLVAPPIGAHNVVVTTSSAPPGGIWSGATSLTGVSQTTPIRDNNQADAEEVGNATVTISSAANDLVVDTVCAGTSVGTPSQTSLYLLNTDGGNACDNIGGSSQAGAGSVTMTWTNMNEGNSDIWVDFASSIEPSGSTPIVLHFGGGKINKAQIGF